MYIQPTKFNTDSKMQDNSGLYPACAITHAMTKKHLTNSHSIYLNDNAKCDEQSQSNDSPTDNGDLDLVGTFMVHLDEPTTDITMERSQESLTKRGVSNCGSTSRWQNKTFNVHSHGQRYGMTRDPERGISKLKIQVKSLRCFHCLIIHYKQDTIVLM